MCSQSSNLSRHRDMLPLRESETVYGSPTLHPTSATLIFPPVLREGGGRWAEETRLSPTLQNSCLPPALPHTATPWSQSPRAFEREIAL